MPSTKVQLSGGAFQDALGDVVANGHMDMQLSQDSQVTGASPAVIITAGRVIRIQLDANGNVQASPAQSVWPNDVLTPANTYYSVKVYTSAGQLVWGPNSQQVLSSPSPYDVGAGWSPARANISSAAATTYDIGVFFPGSPSANQIMLRLPIERLVNFTTNMVPSVSACGTNPTATSVLPINKISGGTTTAVGTLTFNTSGVGTFTTTATSFNAGDIVEVISPSSADATLSDIGITLSGTTNGNS
jgi:hypothetical protein